MNHSRDSQGGCNPAAVFDLRRTAAELRSEAAYLREGHTARTLTRSQDLRVVLVVLRAGATIAEHRTEHTACVQPIEGRLRLRLPKQRVALDAGQLLRLEPGLAHAVEAESDSFFLLTLGWGKSAG